MRTTVVVPTYNERENIGALLTALLRLPLPLNILVVDDRSPDGTAAVVRDAAHSDPRVGLLLRPGRLGFGPAYTAAFQYLLDPATDPEEPPFPEHPQPEVVVQMDADFSHNPEDVPRLLAALEHADIAVGSRYVPGGGTRNWAAQRRALSRGANAYARLLTRARVRDVTAGFLAWKLPLLRAVNPTSIRADGYGYLIALKTRASRLGARIAELPITFTERREGTSKMSPAVIREAMWLVLRLSITRW